MTISEVKEQLKKDGFHTIYEWKDKPYTLYPMTEHKDIVCLYVFEGRVKLHFKEGDCELKAGDKLIIPANTSHTGEVSADGCHFVLGQKSDPKQ